MQGWGRYETMRETDRQIGREGETGRQEGKCMEETEVERREGWVDGCVCGGGVHCDRWGAKEGGTLVHSYRYPGRRGT